LKWESTGTQVEEAGIIPMMVMIKFGDCVSSCLV
jgi:hypothetical protein